MKPQRGRTRSVPVRHPPSPRRRGAGPVDAVAAAAGPLPRPPGRCRRTRRRDDGPTGRTRGPARRSPGPRGDLRRPAPGAGAGTRRARAMRRSRRRCAATVPPGCSAPRSARPGCPTTTAWASSLGCWPHPGVEVTALELAGRTHAPVAADLGPGLDARAKREYRRRLLELQAEIDDAEATRRSRPQRTGARRDGRPAAGAEAGGGTRRSRPPDRVRRRTGPHQRGAQPPTSDRRDRRPGASARRPPRGVGPHRRHCIYLPEPSAALSWRVDTADGATS